MSMFRRVGPGYAAIAATVLVFLLGAQSYAQTGPVLPLSYPKWLELRSNPAVLQQLQAQAAAQQARTVPLESPTSGTWQLVKNKAKLSGSGVLLGNPLLLMDGTVIMQQICAAAWFKLTPDNTGSYVNGTWTQIASLPSGYSPLFNGSGVLPDGRAIIEGGEYNGANGDCGNGVWTNKGAIYDPVANTWASVKPPQGWKQIGDAQAILLPDGTYMQADCCDTPPRAALLNESNLTWTATGTGKFDVYDEEGWTLLPTGDVLTVDAYVFTGTCGTGSELYTPSTGAWSSAGSTINQLADCNSTSENHGPSFEMGPVVMRPDGTAVAFGATLNKSGPNATAHTSIYDANTPGWASGPNLPAVCGTGTENCALADAGAALEPNGSILFAATAGLFKGPTNFFEFNPDNTITAVSDNSDAASTPAFEWNFLVLPSGQILAAPTQSHAGDIWIYTPAGTPNASWAPTITSVPTSLGPDQTYTVSGTQLNGLSQGAYYGDDAQANTNYPLVRVTNTASGHVFYLKTTNSSSYSIAPDASSTASFAVPSLSDIETGPSTLEVVANGIASQPVNVTIAGSENFTLSVSTIGKGVVGSAPAGIDCGKTCTASFPAGSEVRVIAYPDSGWKFDEWRGACHSKKEHDCHVTMNAPESVIAKFEKK